MAIPQPNSDSEIMPTHLASIDLGRTGSTSSTGSSSTEVIPDEDLIIDLTEEEQPQLVRRDGTRFSTRTMEALIAAIEGESEQRNSFLQQPSSISSVFLPQFEDNIMLDPAFVPSAGNITPICLDNSPIPESDLRSMYCTPPNTPRTPVYMNRRERREMEWRSEMSANTPRPPKRKRPVDYLNLSRRERRQMELRSKMSRREYENYLVKRNKKMNSKKEES